MNGVKFGEISARHGGGHPELSPAAVFPGKCRDLTAPAYRASRRHGKGKVQTPKAPAGAAAKAVAGTKIPWWQHRAGSSPAPGTIPSSALRAPHKTFDKPLPLGQPIWKGALYNLARFAKPPKDEIRVCAPVARGFLEGRHETRRLRCVERKNLA